MKSIYTYYKERLIEISGKNRSLFLKSFTKKNGYDLGRILYQNQERAEAFINALWEGKSISFPIVGKEVKDDIISAGKIDERFPVKDFDDEKDRQKYDRQKREYAKKLVHQESQNIKCLKREIEEIEKETGRYELFLCYPFVFGSDKNYTFKAPLLLFPIVIDVIDDNNINISLKYGEGVQLNKALILAMADSQKLNLEGMDMEFESLRSRFADIRELVEYLRGFGIKLSYPPRKSIFPFNRYADPSESDSLEIKNICLLSRCSLANSIYNDYSALEKKHLTNDSINELLNIKSSKRKKQTKSTDLYLINNVDYAQQQVVKNVNENGNMVIYGPPGTGKSQTIVNVISDAIAKNKKVLVVSQKKAALEVIYNRLATLNSKAIFLTDSEKEKGAFYSRCYSSHEKVMSTIQSDRAFREFEEAKKNLEIEETNLKTISDCLTEKTPFGISLQEMYYNSYKIGKKSVEYAIYKDMQKDQQIMALNYQQLEQALSLLKEKNKVELYYNFIENKNKNPFIDHLRDDLSVHIITEAQSKLKRLCSTRQALFDVAKYKYSRQILTYYNEVKTKSNIAPLVKMIAKFEYPQADKWLRTSTVLFPMYPFAKFKMASKESLVKQDLNKTLDAIDDYISEYEFLKDILTNDGYLMALDGILNGNRDILKMLLYTMENYISLRDTNIILKNIDDNQKTVLRFAYKNSTTYLKYVLILNKLLPIRIYHEIVKYEDKYRDVLSMMVDFENTRSKIVALKKSMNDYSRKIAEQGFNDEYKKMFKNTANNKDYIYQISKKQNFWPIRKVMSVYGEYLFKLFPCWLLSPENVSTILPLQRNMFDLVLFDEASQVFIENTIPSIYRGNRIVVAGDAKQLRPTTTFMKRYMGANVDDDLDYSTQAALEVESLLDLAVSRFNSSNITYHYRSRYEELIDFSNKAFYNGKLQIAPNVSKNMRHKAIERIVTKGTWIGGKNLEEAKKVVELTKNILKNRKNNETIGIITFNVEQENCIEDLIYKQCETDEEFRRLYIQETNRIENGEDVSLFIKNLENVQGDERDIIIFSIAYAKNEYGKVNSMFGSLSNEGGENRLNVAITRAKQKIYVVTSIEPEELKVENAKFKGPRLLRSYLTYVRAVSEGNYQEMKAILDSFNEPTLEIARVSSILPIEEQISAKLSKMGYKTEINLGNSNSKISVAVYDKKKDRYLLGIETDQTVINSSSSAIERDVFRNEFLKSKGWKIFRVWSRDWWHNSSQVMSALVRELERQKKALYADVNSKKKA